MLSNHVTQWKTGADNDAGLVIWDAEHGVDWSLYSRATDLIQVNFSQLSSSTDWRWNRWAPTEKR